MEQRKRVLRIFIWRHSCPLHGEHVCLWGSDCETTARDNAEELHRLTVRACVWTGVMHEYSHDLSEIEALKSEEEMPW